MKTHRLSITVLVLAAASACPKPPASPPASAPDASMTVAAQSLAKDLSTQLGTRAEPRLLVIDPILDRASGQQTALSQQLQGLIGVALISSGRNLQVVPFDSGSVTKAHLVATGTVASLDTDRHTISIAVIDRATGEIVAQSAARFRQASANATPTAFYSDSPAVVRDRSVEGYVRTSQATVGQQADALYLEQLPTSALLAQALTDYNAGDWENALAAYTEAARRQDGQQLRTFNGLYLTNYRLRRPDEAEAAFSRIASLGLATNNLAVKILFQPGTTEFHQGDLTGMYPMWLRQIARAVQSSGACLDIVGHTSRSGSEALNDRLSLSRAETIKRALEAETPALSRQLRASGVGYSQNIIGTGRDDASDAIDRRVEFKVVPCARLTDADR